MEKCIFIGCVRVQHARGLCRTHYDKLRRNGALKPSKPVPQDPLETIANNSEWQGECLVWQRSVKPNGYGQIRVGGKTLYVHRIVWEREHGKIPEGFEIDHTCHNPPCINLKHLRLATRGQNMGHRKGGWGESGIKNVYITESGTFRVRIYKDKMRHNFGTYKNLVEAAKVAEAENLKLYGEFSI